MGKHYRQLQWEDRVSIEALYNNGMSVREIADYLHCHISTIYRELKRGEYVHTNTDLTETKTYASDKAQIHYENGLKNRGANIKLEKDYAFADFVEDRIINDRWSPDAIIGYLSLPENQDMFSVSICTKTLYNWIEAEIFLNISNKDLPVKRNEKRKYNHIKRQKRSSAGESISNRPEEINTREEFGHWEMDSVIGSLGKSKNTLVVLTERKTREEIIVKVSDHTSNSVVGVLNKLERKYGRKFKQIFKSITVDNGTEFSDVENMKASCKRKGDRTNIYYCHAYSSWERGSNENQNKLIRRWIEKGRNFDDVGRNKIEDIQNWMNNYPRRIFGYKTSEELFQHELEKIA